MIHPHHAIIMTPKGLIKSARMGAFLLFHLNSTSIPTLTSLVKKERKMRGEGKGEKGMKRERDTELLKLSLSHFVVE